MQRPAAPYAPQQAGQSGRAAQKPVQQPVAKAGVSRIAKPAPAPAPVKKKRPKWLLPVCIAGGAAVIVALILVLVLTGNKGTETNGGVAQPTATPKPATTADVNNPGSATPRPAPTPAVTPTPASDLAGRYNIETIKAANGTTMDREAMKEVDIDVDNTYLLLNADMTGVLSLDNQAADITWSEDGTFRSEGEEYQFTWQGDQVEITMNIPDMDMAVTMMFRRVGGTQGGTENGMGGECGQSAKWSFDGVDTLRIYGSGQMDDYEYTTEIPWYNFKAMIEHVIIEQGITHIGRGAFYYCEMTDVQIPASVREISTYAFTNCKYLTSVTLQGSPITLGEEAFSGCSALTNVRFTGSVSEIDINAFWGCDATVSYPANDTSWNSFVGKDFGGTLTWIPSGSSSTTSVVNRYYSDKYSIAIPASWTGLYMLDADGDSLTLSHAASVNDGYGGHVFTINLYKKYSDFSDFPSYEVIGTLSKDGDDYIMVATYPTDVQFAPQYQSEYMQLYSSVYDVFQYVSGEGGYDFSYQ